MNVRGSEVCDALIASCERTGDECNIAAHCLANEVRAPSGLDVIPPKSSLHGAISRVARLLAHAQEEIAAGRPFTLHSPCAPDAEADPLAVYGFLLNRLNSFDQLPGPSGIRGLRGERGSQGNQGIQGIQGFTGTGGDFPNPTDAIFDQVIRSIVAELIAAGVDVIIGEQGPPGEPGAPGAPGEPGPAPPVTEPPVPPVIVPPGPIPAPGGSLNVPAIPGAGGASLNVPPLPGSAELGPLRRPVFPGAAAFPPQQPPGRRAPTTPRRVDIRDPREWVRTIVAVLRDAQNQRRARQLADAQRRALERYSRARVAALDRLRLPQPRPVSMPSPSPQGVAMPFGQMGYMSSSGGGGGGFDWPSSSDVWDVAQTGIGILGSIFAPGAAPVQIPAGPTMPQAPPPPSGVDVAAQLVQYLGGEGITGSGSQLFRPPTASMKPRPVNKVQVMGPDGKCHTWLHATPKGWKVNASNVSGRRRHHHHPR